MKDKPKNSQAWLDLIEPFVETLEKLKVDFKKAKKETDFILKQIKEQQKKQKP